VGPQFEKALRQQNGLEEIQFQGVDPTKYKATVDEYLGQWGGSNDGAEELARMVINYHEICPETLIVIAGWR